MLKSNNFYIWAILWLVQMDKLCSIVGREIAYPNRENKSGSETEQKKELIALADPNF